MSEYINEEDTSYSIITILFFFIDWCPYSKIAKPIWDEIKNEYQYNEMNGSTLFFTEIDCTDQYIGPIDQMMTKLKVKFYPTIKIIKHGHLIEFEEEIIKDNFIEFLNQVI